jgi:molybdenum cofactor cytidylyltransferase
MSGVGAIVLAAGASARMGEAKQLLVFEGEALIRRAAAAAVAAGCEPVIVVLGARAHEIAGELSGLPVHPVVNSAWPAGMGTSIRAGVRAVLEVAPDVRAVVLMLCDQPFVTAATIARLVAEQQRSGKPVCVSSYAGTVGPPVCVAAELFPSLLSLPDGQGAKALWAERAEEVYAVACEEAGVDVDTPEEYRRLLVRGRESARFQPQRGDRQ